MAKVYVTLAPIGVKDPNGNYVSLLRGRPFKDAEFNTTGASAKLTATVADFVTPDDQVGGVFTRYAWIVKAVDGAIKAVQAKNPNASTGVGWRLAAGDSIEFAAEEAGETLALVNI